MTGKPSYEELEKRIQELEQEKAEVSKELYGTLINKIQAAVVLHGADTKIIASNPKAQELLGLTETQMFGREAVDPCWKFLDSDGTALLLEKYPVNQVLKTRQELRDHTFGIYRSDKDDNVRVSVSADPVINDKGEIEQVIVTFMDITDRKQAEEAIIESEKRYHHLFNSGNDAVLVHHVTEAGGMGLFIDVNDTACRMYGYTREELMGLEPKDIPNDLDQKRRREIKTALLAEKQVSYETVNVSKDGSKFPVEINANIIELGGEQAVFAIVRDVTERKKAEREKENLILDLRKTLFEVKTLRGILPICANCKKIRDDKGYWNQVESYVRDHTEATFSHSICPECTKKLYPDLDPHKGRD